MPTFGHEIKRLREDKKWDQKTLCDKAGKLDYSILSRIESGRTKAPNEETVRRLAQALDVPADDLLALAAGLRQPDRTTVRVGAAHCIWSAPVFLLAMRDRLPPELSMTSYGVMGGAAGSELGDPYWYNAQATAVQHHVKAGPTFVGCGAPNVKGVQEWPPPPVEQLHAYTANDLVDLLKVDPPALDCLVAAQEAVKSYSKKTRRCARLVRAEGGCSLLLAASQEGLRAFNGSSHRDGFQSFQEFWKRVTVKSIPNLPTICAKGTIAEQHLDLLHKGRDSNKPAFNPVTYVDLGVWDDVVATVKNVLGIAASGGSGRRTAATRKTEEAGPKPAGAFAFIGWEPQLSWLEAELKKMGAVPFPLGQVTDVAPGSKLPSLSFDIILRDEALDASRPAVGIRPFLDRLDEAVKDLRDSAGPTSSAVQFIARYLNMEPQRCFDALAGLEFELMYYPEWVEHLQG